MKIHLNNGLNQTAYRKSNQTVTSNSDEVTCKNCRKVFWLYLGPQGLIQSVQPAKEGVVTDINGASFVEK